MHLFPLYLLLLAPFPILTSAHPDLPFWNTSLSWEDRVDDLVSRLTVDELVSTLARGGGRKLHAPNAYNLPIPRLGIGAYNFFTVCFYGIQNQMTTIFPQTIGLAATFSPDTIRETAKIISIEARGLHNTKSKQGVYDDNTGISCMAPFINIMHYPLWGRVQEIYGEDPYLSSTLGTSFIHGLHGDHPKYVRTSSTCITIAAYSGPENIPMQRFVFDAEISERDLRLTYLPAFKACIDAQTFGLMCSYYSVNGQPSCANERILSEIVRREYGFEGFVISDAGAIEWMYTKHKYVKSYMEAAVVAINAGVNLELQPEDLGPLGAFGTLGTALAKGLVSYETLVARAKPLFYTRMRQGEFDPPEWNPYNDIDISVLQSPAHREKAVEVTAQSFVLLKNVNRTLPIVNKIEHLAVVGPFANDIQSLFGDYSPTVQDQYVTTPYEGLQALAKVTTTAAGCTAEKHCDKYDRTGVEKAVLQADVVVVCLGTGNTLESEGHDRANYSLPGHQMDLLQDVVTWAVIANDVSPQPKTAKGRPVILVLFTAGPVDLQWAKSIPKVSAIIQCFFPGQSAGTALRRVMAVSEGLVFSPAGRLPYTWPKSMEQVPPVTNFSMEGRTYRYFQGDPLYPFGYGLSYSEFMYSNLVITPGRVIPNHNVTVSVMVQNLGPYPADEVIQVYLSWLNCSVPMPQRQLVGVTRKSITSIRSPVQVKFVITPDQMKIWDDKQGFIYHNGQYLVSVGGQQPNQKTTVNSNILQSTLEGI